MARHHATSGEVINIRPFGEKLKESVSTALLKTPNLEVIRLVLEAGRSIPEHMVACELTLQCLEGAMELTAHQQTQVVRAGEMIYLEGRQPYAIRALEDASALLTILLKDGSASPLDVSPA